MEPRAHQSPQELLLPHSNNFYSQFLVIDLLKFLIVININIIIIIIIIIIIVL